MLPLRAPTSVICTYRLSRGGFLRLGLARHRAALPDFTRSDGQLPQHLGRQRVLLQVSIGVVVFRHDAARFRSNRASNWVTRSHITAPRLSMKRRGYRMTWGNSTGLPFVEFVWAVGAKLEAAEYDPRGLGHDGPHLADVGVEPIERRTDQNRVMYRCANFDPTFGRETRRRSAASRRRSPALGSYAATRVWVLADVHMPTEDGV